MNEVAFKWYKKLVNEYREKKRVYNLRGFDSPLIQSRDWEVFGSILLKDKAKPGNGCDLHQHEIKSAQVGSGFEYQYHLRSGMEKWRKDISISHLLISYGPDYDDIQARLLTAVQASQLMDHWRLKIEDSYHGSQKKQRCRENITYDQAVRHGRIVFEVVRGELVTRVV